ncbi:MAG: 4Fe-4S binding protein [Nitrospirae bacterium]|nr:4Fe-4S binding protein [Nitrospirota bacterium]
MQNLRRITQGIFLLIFLFLFIQTESKGADELGYPVKIFLDFNPLILITTLFSSHAVQKAFYFSVIIILITLLFGRVFCGWACPLGTLNNIIGSFRKKPIHTANKNWHGIKYYILIFLLASSVFTLQLTGIMDPISLLIRSFSLSIYPLFNYGASAVFDSIYNLKEITGVSESIYSVLKNSFLSFRQPFFNQSAFVGLIFFAILGLNLIEKRFWCKHLCPLGALLGLLSKYSILSRSVSEGCTSCGICDTVCQGGANPDLKENWRDTECLYCFNCDDICPQNAVSFGFHSSVSPLTNGGIKEGPQKTAMGLGRRQVIISMLSGVTAVPLIRTSPFSKPEIHNPELIRPPGSLEEKDFLKRCVKCGECMKVCITNGLQPALFDSGLEGIWSPLLIPKIGYCEYRCTLCGQVCPTGAIKRLSLEEKKKVKIGLAVIDKNKCLPYAHATPCIVCEEVCPTSKKAIWFENNKVKNRKGKEFTIKQPRVDAELCIGCGICEAKCPVGDSPAIYVTSIGESRSKENQLLLGYL